MRPRLPRLVCLLAAQAALASTSDGSSLTRRSYVLTSQIQAELLSVHEKGTEEAKRTGNLLDRGPARFFLETHGIEFPYRAAAILRDRNYLMVVDNTAENLVRVDRLMEQLYSNTDDNNTLRSLLNEAELAYGSEVFVPAPDFLTALDGGTPKMTPSQPAPQPFDPQTMDFETLQHGGIVYTNVIVTGSNPVELEILHAAGVAVLPLRELHPSIQRQYGFNAEKARAVEQASLPAGQGVSANSRPKPREVVRQYVGTQASPGLAEASSEPRKNPQAAGTVAVDIENVDIVDGAAEANPIDGADNFAGPRATGIVDEQKAVGDVELADGNDNNEQGASGPSGKSTSRVYLRIHTRDGRVFENVAVRPDHMGFSIRKQAQSGKREERISFWDAPSSLLLDFEKFEELFSRMLVAKDRTHLYELNRDGTEGGKPFHELAKDPPVGRGFVSVPEGYVFANMNWMSLPQPAVELVRGIGRRSFALGDAGNLVGLSGSEWWNRYAGHKTPRLSVPSKLARKEPSKLGVLYSIFDPEVPILGNRAGEILNLWVDGKTDQNGLLALVETGNGLFLGYYREHAALGGGELTWEDAVSNKTRRFHLRKVSSQKIRQGERLLKLFDASARRILGADFKEIEQLKLSASHYDAILERGVEAAVQDRVLPKGDGVRFPESGVATATSPSFEKVIITDQILAKLKDVLPQAYVFDVESQQRVIEIRKREVGGRISLQESNPKRQKQNEVVEVSPDLDGGLRLTDGKVIYELKPVLGGTELVVWEAEPNNLRRL